MFRFVVLSCLLIFVQSARFLEKPKPLDGRIVGGERVDISEVPYQVSLQHTQIHICGGSLISKNFVLTAAHCTNGATEYYLSVRIGSSQHASGGIVVSVKKINQHPQYNAKTIDYDFSVLELFGYNSNGLVSGYVNLPNQGGDIEDGTILKVSGWGLTKSFWEVTDNLRAVDVPKFKQARCKQYYSNRGLITDRMICAGFEMGGKDACQGDSGGPLVTNNYQFGVVSWGYGCALSGYPGVYARVASVRDWIKTVSSV